MKATKNIYVKSMFINAANLQSFNQWALKTLLRHYFSRLPSNLQMRHEKRYHVCVIIKST